MQPNQEVAEQNDQADEVTVLMPPEDSRLLTRELFYTAVTRARRRVHVVGTESSVRAAIGRRGSTSISRETANFAFSLPSSARAQNVSSAARVSPAAGPAAPAHAPCRRSRP